MDKALSSTWPESKIMQIEPHLIAGRGDRLKRIMSYLDKHTWLTYYALIPSIFHGVIMSCLSRTKKLQLTIQILFSVIILTSCSGEGQVPDESFNPEIRNPVYAMGKGPVIFVDEAHENFHTIGNRYRPFARLLERDGYRLKSATQKIGDDLLTRCGIFVISVPTSVNYQSAYTHDEIKALKNWVEGGGSLLMITDHTPDPPAIAELALAFGIRVNNGYVLNEDPDEEVGPIFFRREDGTLADHPITEGREDYDERIDKITSFTGCAFLAGDDFTPLMTFGFYKTLWMTENPDEFPPDTPKIDVEGWYQGGVMEYGKGRVAFFGEAGMFTAQIIVKPDIKFGMNVPIADENTQFLLNIFHWLSRVI
jgi:hypothetical protein